MASKSDKNAPPAQMRGFRLIQCGRCERYYAAEFEHSTNCPYCGSKFMAASEVAYEVIRQE